jgi:hypothetical protein
MREIRSDWQAMFLTLLMPAVIVSGLVYLALQPQWTDSDDWLIGVFVLLPLEFARIIILRILRDAYKDYRSPWYAVKFFLVSVLILAGIVFVIALFELGIHGLLAALGDARIWRLIVPSAIVVIVDGVIALYFFHGNARIESARLDAAADDAEDWFMLSVTRLPFVTAIVYAVLIYMRTRGMPVPAWIPDPDREAFREICLLYVAVYFAGKAIVLAYVHTAHFNRTGRRLLGAGWVRFVLGEKRARYGNAARAEARSAQERHVALQGDDTAQSPVAGDRP